MKTRDWSKRSACPCPRSCPRSTRTLFRTSRALLSAITMGVLASASLACSNDTGGQRFSFDARIGGVSRDATNPAEPLTFTNEKGWTISLAKANVTVGPVYLNVVAPLRDSTQTFLDFFVKSAWAHGEGHLGSGRIVGEVLGQVTFDATSPSLVDFPVRGNLTQEEVRTAEIWFYPKPGTSPEAVKPGVTALDVAGVASRGADTVRFRGALVLNDAWQPDQTDGTRGTQSLTDIRKVRGIPSLLYPTADGHLELRMDVKQLFRGADFSNLAANPTDADGTKVLVQSKSGPATTDQVMTNLYQGLRATGTYSVSWMTP